MSMKFEIGDEVICIKTTASGYIHLNEMLVLGESYVINDIDFHFPNKVCVKLKGPYYFHYEFILEECFSKLSEIRDKKLKELGI
jgi:hypothetical protein